MSSNFLFVYGTLRPGFAHPMAQYLARNARHLGPAMARGRLYRLGRYPGMTQTTDGNEWVHGDVYELPDDKGQTLRELDAYENDESPQPAFFDRQITCITLASGEEEGAWVYWFRGPIKEEDRILSGNWLSPGSI